MPRSALMTPFSSAQPRILGFVCSSIAMGRSGRAVHFVSHAASIMALPGASLPPGTTYARHLIAELIVGAEPPGQRGNAGRSSAHDGGVRLPVLRLAIPSS